MRITRALTVAGVAPFEGDHSGAGHSTSDVVIIGGGSAGLSTALAIASLDPERSITVIDGRRPGRDPRTWCYWDEGTNPAPEAVTASWSRWEIRTSAGTATAGDDTHPYRMVRANDYRAAMSTRLGELPTVTVIQGAHVTAVPTAAAPNTSHTNAGVFDAPITIDARGTGYDGELPDGRMRLHQRFIGQWIHTTRPVFDQTTVTLMDFTLDQNGTDVGFVYVLPVSATEALVESTVFTADRSAGHPFRETIAQYVASRWQLRPEEWTVVGEEAGCVPMTDARPAVGGIPAVGLRGGVARSSTGYAFSRIHRHAAEVARAVVTGEPIAGYHDSWRIRSLDAIFLRFLRDQPTHAPAVFLRMFGALPGEVTVRFLTERSSVLDELRMIAVLPKRWFLRAAFTTIRERITVTALRERAAGLRLRTPTGSQ